MSRFGRGMIVYEDVPNIRIELTEGCNRSCEFCGHKYLKTEKKFMTQEMFRSILYRCEKSLKSLHFTVNGEPTLNPGMLEYLEEARKFLPNTNIQIITNGDQYIKRPQEVFSLFEYGASLVILDLYTQQQKERWDLLLRPIYGSSTIVLSEGGSVDVVNGYGRELTEYYNSKPGTKKVLAIYDETDKFGKGVDAQHKRVLHTWCGSIPSNMWTEIGAKPMSYFPHKAPCTEPMKFLNIGVNGEILSCCRDMSKSFVLGNILQYSTMNDVWRSTNMYKMRLILKNGRRDLIPVCFFCNERSTRVGLYPYAGDEFTAEELIKFIEEHYTPNPILRENFKTYRHYVSEDYTVFKRGIV